MLQQVPLFDKEVTEDTFIEYEKRMRADEKLKDMDEVESHRVAVAKFMQRVSPLYCIGLIQRYSNLLMFHLPKHNLCLD